jgi:hypothetical protein
MHAPPRGSQHTKQLCVPPRNLSSVEAEDKVACLQGALPTIYTETTRRNRK